ncbi:phosphohydrolase [Pseudomonas lurida]|uniref:HD domain-containing protein n=1 Tax=Pseudomonas lurida TaxID=244566 RepID=UPI0016572B1A|nr:HD domain-containing protein [Pseudomonas lurida]MBC8982400.1 phosphohydrolase [Pseudomonas lurida]
MKPTLQATFHHMRDGTLEDWRVIADEQKLHALKLPDRILDHLRLLGGDYGGFAVDRLTHSLQTATLAHLDGKDEEYVVCALLHDIGDTLASFNHADMAAVILQPFVSAENHWMVANHGLFQGYYFFQYLGLDRNSRDQFSHLSDVYQRTIEFCEKYDAAAFDPGASTLPLEFFEPFLRRVMTTPKRSIYMAMNRS